MRYDLKKPCKSCPFRTDVEPFLPVARVREIVRSITVQQQTFSCHNTNEFDEEEGYAIETSDSRHCAGAMIFLMANDQQNGGMNQMMRIAYRLNMFDPDALDLAAPVYDTLEDWEDAIREGGLFSHYSEDDDEEIEGVYC